MLIIRDNIINQHRWTYCKSAIPSQLCGTIFHVDAEAIGWLTSPLPEES